MYGRKDDVPFNMDIIILVTWGVYGLSETIQSSEMKIQKVKDYLRIKSKKSGATRKKSVA
jgi:hypothetical protein